MSLRRELPCGDFGAAGIAAPNEVVAERRSARRVSRGRRRSGGGKSQPPRQPVTLIRVFREHQVDFLVIGGLAVPPAARERDLRAAPRAAIIRGGMAYVGLDD